MRKLPALIATIAILLVQIPVSAQAEPPWAMADALDDALFAAQRAGLTGDAQAAARAVADASATLDALLDAYPDFPADAAAHARGALETAAQGGNALAAAKGELHTALLHGSYELTRSAIAAGDLEAARQWLLVRDFRPATKFDRPGADATLALEELAAGQISPADAQERVRADLLDTYQANLFRSLGNAQDPSLLPARRSEEAGMAEGYWQILAPAFAEQAGEGIAAEVSAQFDALTAAAIENEVSNENNAAVDQHAGAILAEIRNFRAAPLTHAELTRRTGQLLRYLSLVPVEYARGVKDGQVFTPFEVQEATTFMQGAQAAFADLRPDLARQDPAQAENVQTRMNDLQRHVEAANRQEAVLPVDELRELSRSLDKSLNELIPPAWNQLDPDADFDVIATVLDQMEAAVAAGDYAMAESAHLEAYAVFDFGAEQRLLAFAPELVSHIDGVFWQGYNGEPGLAAALAGSESAPEISAIRTNLDGLLVEAQRTLGDLPSAPGAVITNAAIIVFREGLEAVVILAALTAGFVGSMSRYRRDMALGALAAGIASVATGILMQGLLRPFAHYGERLEALISLLAIGVILLITNWFFHKTYWKDHMKEMHQHKAQIVKGAQAGSGMGLVLLGFTSVYREGFETALFLQALLLNAGASIVLQGVLLGAIGVLAAGVVTVALQRRLPYMKMFIVTAVLIGLVLVTMVGNTVHVMQKVGWMPLHPIQWLDLPYWMGLWFGVFPTWEGIGFQFLAAAFVLGSYFGAEALRKRERRQLRRRMAAEGKLPVALKQAGR
ncbi:MAG: FTR1 family protein [Caldilineaceae bacterium]|nr:FTR1 family protein [Caldilineaceae bacterium]